LQCRFRELSRKDACVKKNNMEFIVGGFILVALFILIAGVLWLKSSTIARSMVEYTVMFPNVGMLSQGDPIKVNGVSKGVTKSIMLHGVKVEVVIKLDKDVILTDSSIVTIQNIGLMGERMISILLSDKGKPIKPSGKGHITVINGFFDTGIAEAMGMLGTVLTDVRVLVANIASIVDSTVGAPAFYRAFENIVGRLDTVTRLAQTLIEDNRGKIDKSMTNIKTVTSDIKELLDMNKAQINTIVSDGTQLTGRALAIASTVDTITISLQTMVKRIEKGEGSVGMLLSDEQFYKDLKKAVSDLSSLLGEVQQDGLKLRLKFGFKKEPVKPAQ
jgi:phospholipid/cholesterol/gamma-HCH transport system substrate-binding protein